ncbi:MAG: IS110 family transposase [Acidimicrobiales bacterium]
MPGPGAVVGGADTHADTVHVALITALGRDLADREFPTTPAGYRAAVEFCYSRGPITRVGIEGTSSYGAGLSRAARAGGLQVLEVNRPNRAERRRRGKSDPIDAYQAAHAVLSGRATSAPKTESIEGLRALRTARRSAVKARTAAANQIHQLLITAPDPVRDKFRGLTDKKLVKTLANCRPACYDPINYAVLIALKTIAQRHRYLHAQITYLTDAITALVRAANPGLLAAHGVGPDTASQLLITAGGNPDRLRSEASFAALCGTAPVPASSGKITRHRLSRGGDRGANNALHHIAVVRMSSHPPTKAYVARHRAAGRPTPEILRMLKRAIAREMFKYLTRRVTAPAIDDLRPTRQAKNITLTRAAAHFGLWPTALSRIENGTKRDDALAQAYRNWLQAA